MRGRMFGRTERRKQHSSHTPQVGFERGQPIVAISQKQARRTFGHVIGDCTLAAGSST